MTHTLNYSNTAACADKNIDRNCKNRNIYIGGEARRKETTRKTKT
jgi:hypothetical protein